jgi:hypothetical protein
MEIMETPTACASMVSATALGRDIRLCSFLGLFGTLALLATGCAGSRLQVPDPPAVPLRNAQSFLMIPTYDGSGQVTEPDVVSFDLAWHGFKYWMAFSPYPRGDASKENPSIAVSNDGISWEVPAGLVNPLAQPSRDAHLADASLFYDSASDELWIYYIEESRARKTTKVFKLASLDGIHWRDQGVLLQVPVDTLVSPTVAKVNGTYYMWTVNVKWSDARPSNMVQAGYVIWHLNASYVAPKQEYWAAVAAYAKGSDCGHTVLFSSKSQDGINWTTYSKPVLGPSTTWDDREIYRSSLLFDSSTNRLRVWYSAASKGEVWHVGLSEGDFDAFLEWLNL